MKEVMEVNSTILDEEKYSSCEGGGTPFFSNSILSLSAETVAAKLKVFRPMPKLHNGFKDLV